MNVSKFKVITLSLSYIEPANSHCVMQWENTFSTVYFSINPDAASIIGQAGAEHNGLIQTAAYARLRDVLALLRDHVDTLGFYQNGVITPVFIAELSYDALQQYGVSIVIRLPDGTEHQASVQIQTRINRKQSHLLSICRSMISRMLDEVFAAPERPDVELPYKDDEED